MTRAPRRRHHQLRNPAGNGDGILVLGASWPRWVKAVTSISGGASMFVRLKHNRVHHGAARLATDRRFRYIDVQHKEIAVARVKMIKPEEADAETRKVYDGVVKQWGRISNFSQVLAHQPAALAGWMLPNQTIRLVNVKSDPDYVKIQQLVIIKTSALNQSAYCMSHNVPLGKKLGLDAGADRGRAGQRLYGIARPRRPPEGGDPLGRRRHEDEARDDEAAFAAMRSISPRSRSSSSRCSAACGTIRTGCAKRCTSTSSGPTSGSSFRRSSLQPGAHEARARTRSHHGGHQELQRRLPLRGGALRGDGGPQSVVACNCSICQKRGALWTFVPARILHCGRAPTICKDYQFGRRSIHHLFCPQCGVGAFSRGKAPSGAEMVAVNVRCLDDIDVTTLEHHAVRRAQLESCAAPGAATRSSPPFR